MIKKCIECGTTESRKWYKKENGFLCQRDYRHSRYVARQEEIKAYQKSYYQSNRNDIISKALSKYHNAKVTDSRCHQKIIRDKLLEDDLKRLGSQIRQVPIFEYELSQENFTAEHRQFIETYEWLGHVGNSPKWIFVARCHGHLAGVVLLNEPNCYSKNLLKDIDTQKLECLIQRGACASWAHEHLGSKLIRFACKEMVRNTTKRIFVAYSDPKANEIGTIYQACGFDYLGNKYGARYAYKHPTYKKKKVFSAQSLKRTSTLKKYLASRGITWKKEWEKPNGFKDSSKLPRDIKQSWDMWAKKIIQESKRIKRDTKGKYVLVLGKDRREQAYLNRQKKYIKQTYPKRS